MVNRVFAVALSVCTSLSAIAADVSVGPQADLAPAGIQTTPSLTPVATPSPTQASAAFTIPFPAWSRHVTDHFVVAYPGDAYALRATRQGELLEHTHGAFYDAFDPDAFGVRPAPSPLVCLFFDDKADYLRYAKRVDRVDMSWTVAYYSARTNRIAFYRYGETSPDLDAPAPAGGDGLYGNADAGHAHEHRIALASATHEAAHQLAFNSGLQKRGILYPLWVSEGLATNFELQQRGGDLGPMAGNPARTDRLTQLLRSSELEGLSTFVTVTRPPTNDAIATDAAYAQAWGLFRFLYETRRPELAKYLDLLRNQPRGPRDRYTLRGEFTECFGPIATIEPQWRAWIASLDQPNPE